MAKDILLEMALAKKVAGKIEKGGGIPAIASMLLASQTQAHIFHLQTKSYAEHKALGAYYEGIDGLVDGLVEAYQGKYGIIDKYEAYPIEKYNSKAQVLKYLDDLCYGVDTHRKGVEDSYLQNLIDGIVELLASTKYKIEFLA